MKFILMGKRSKFNRSSSRSNSGYRNTEFGFFKQNSGFQRKYNKSNSVMYLPKSSGVSPERRKQLELERKKREEFENNFTCKVESKTATEIDNLMRGENTFLKRRVTFGMENRGNTCFFNSVMQCLAHSIPLHEYCVADKSHDKFC